MLRHHLAVKLNLRITPELAFIKDGSIEHGAKIARLIEEIHASDDKSEEQ
jgi:ribosome-binding factor A